jgi:anti-anti-sigma regulatory factor
MKYNISKNCLKLHDSLSLENVGELIKMFNEELPPKSKKLVVDLKEIESIDTAVVQFFINFKINLEKQEKSVHFINLSESLKKDIDLLSLEYFFDETSHSGVK